MPVDDARGATLATKLLTQLPGLQRLERESTVNKSDKAAKAMERALLRSTATVLRDMGPHKVSEPCKGPCGSTVLCRACSIRRERVKEET